MNDSVDRGRVCTAVINITYSTRATRRITDTPARIRPSRY